MRSAADPDRLDGFSLAGNDLNRELVAPRLAALEWADVVYGRFPPVDGPALGPLIEAVAGHLARTGELADWVGQVGLAFREAGDGAPGPVVVADPEALAALLGPDRYGTNSPSERRGRALGLTGPDLAHYLRGADLAGAQQAAVAAGDTEALAALIPTLDRYRADPLAATGYYDRPSPTGAVTLLRDLRALADPPLIMGPPPAVDFAGLVSAMSIMLGTYSRAGVQVDGAGWRAALQPPVFGPPVSPVVASFASTGTFSAEFGDLLLDAVLADNPVGYTRDPGRLPPWDVGHHGWEWPGEPPLDARDPQAMVLAAIDRSGTASAILAHGTETALLHDPDRVYSAAAAETLDRVLDQPRLDLLDRTEDNDQDAANAVARMVEATGGYGGETNPEASVTLARLVVEYPGDIAGIGLGGFHAPVPTTLGHVLANLPNDPALPVHFVSAARLADVRTAEFMAAVRWPTESDGSFHLTPRQPPPDGYATWDAAINGQLGGFAREATENAVRTKLADPEASDAWADRAGQAHVTIIGSGYERRHHDHQAIDAANGRNQWVGGALIDIVSLPASPVTGLVADQLGETALELVWPTDHADQAPGPIAEDLRAVSAATLAVVLETGVEIGAVDPASLPTALLSDPDRPEHGLKATGELVSSARTLEALRRAYDLLPSELRDCFQELRERPRSFGIAPQIADG
ncbi:MAG: hypothetical protein ACRD0U_09495 [Acidimicrobiales bacterium]